MNQTHGKMFSLQHITVKVPGQRLPLASVPPQTTAISETEPAGGRQMDPGRSVSPSSQPDGIRTNGTSSERGASTSTETSITVTPSSPGRHMPSGGEEYDSPDSSTDIPTQSEQYPFSHHYISHHQRNTSMDEQMLMQLKTSGVSFPPVTPPPETRERAMTLQRFQSKHKKANKSHLAPISHSEEDLTESSRGSQENIKGSLTNPGIECDWL